MFFLWLSMCSAPLAGQAIPQKFLGDVTHPPDFAPRFKPIEYQGATIRYDESTLALHLIVSGKDKRGRPWSVYVLPPREIAPGYAYFAGADLRQVPMRSLADPRWHGDITEDFMASLENAWNVGWPKPRVLVMSFPHNPTGATVDLDFMQKVVDFARDRGANRVIWLTNEDNVAARSLYDAVARTTGLIQYRLDPD